MYISIRTSHYKALNETVSEASYKALLLEYITKLQAGIIQMMNHRGFFANNKESVVIVEFLNLIMKIKRSCIC